ncbi:hypothetical protein K493DRAFT_46381 [Basidiobolus meristosporus CBS 931.73]|uniref:TPR-like protein n=1 Tax=Basidiobolus meristosporus CBS 931.73 TaxID=1314790 RepID=A0A1Y1Y2T8_9FUNG|nr:hypothetical protein K493DRAFT_46381 [Basidiobolus meristosporus CBS 931.73]|eukprot:ORX92026.1 hypothetical protein K493DRAFT_46381 [Basidiobolus meristosporus CBS 931.73]
MSTSSSLPLDALIQVNVFSNAALKLRQEGKHQEAIPLFAKVTSIIENIPDRSQLSLLRQVHSDSYWNLATSYLETGNVAKAEFAYTRCLDLRKGSPSAELEVLEKLVCVYDLLDKKEMATNLTKRMAKVRAQLDSEA